MQALRAQLGFPLTAGWDKDGDGHGNHSTVQDCHGGACISFTPHGASGAAIAAALKSADIALVFGATICGEGEDRIDLTLEVPTRWNRVLKRDDLQGQDAFITMVGIAAKAAGVLSVGAIVTPGPLLTPWSKHLDSLLVSFMPGQEYGFALMDVLFGTVNPSGRLPVTFPNKENELDFSGAEYPGSDGNCTGKESPRCDPPGQANYSHQLLIGYRYYDAKGIVPKYAFGHGLSFTRFNYSFLTASKSHVSFTLTNTGSLDGAEIVQLYLDFPAASRSPPQQLKGFSRVFLKAGASTQVTMPLTSRDRSIWGVGKHDWEEVSGTVAVRVGASSRDIRLEGFLPTN
jgi:beta-glucosidase